MFPPGLPLGRQADLRGLLAVRLRSRGDGHREQSRATHHSPALLNGPGCGTTIDAPLPPTSTSSRAVSPPSWA